MMFRPIDQVLARLRDPKQTPTGWSARCPAHDDRKASLSISETDDGIVLLKCHAGCGVGEIVEALGLSLRDLFPSRRSGPYATDDAPVWPTARAGLRHLVSRYGRYSRYWAYTDAAGTPVGLTAHWTEPIWRWEWLHRVEQGWRLGPMPTPRPLYRLARLVDSQGQQVVLVDGEWNADALAEVGMLATCCAGGHKAAVLADLSPLRGRVVWLLASLAMTPAFLDTVTWRVLDAGATELHCLWPRDWSDGTPLRWWLSDRRAGQIVHGDPRSLVGLADVHRVHRRGERS